MTDVEIAGLEAWLPLDLDATAEELESALVARFARGGSDPLVEATASGLAGVAQDLRHQAATLEDEGVVLLGAWAFLDEPGVLSPSALALFRRLPLAADEELGALEQQLVAGVELQRPVERDEVSTGSGTAFGLRFRPVVGAGGERQVHEQLCVSWLRPQHGAAFVLSCYVTDLVEAPTVYLALCRLAEGVTGL